MPPELVNFAVKNSFKRIQMDGIELIKRYFPELTDRQLTQFEIMGRLYPEWNAKINVISRKDIDRLWVNHILHSLAIARFLGPLVPGTTIMDLGTGGGFPGIPLAVIYPEVQFTLIDRIGKKLRVAGDVAAQAGIGNVRLIHGDSGECHDRFDYVVSRAVMPLDKLVAVAARNVTRKPHPGNRYSPGIICLKGGDLTEESRAVRYPVVEYSLDEFIPGQNYGSDDKKLVYVCMNC